jgi:hypothetical protein
MKIQDTLIVVLSDTHSGGSTALFPNRYMQFKHSDHKPSKLQRAMWKHFEKCAQYAREHRQGKRLIVIHNGDAIEGVHHGSLQAVTFIKDEQAEIHIELMDYFLTAADFNRETDQLFYVSGTEVHVGEKEDRIAKDLGANGKRAYDQLELEVNGKMLWIAHHGKKKGAGANEGNALRNFLRDQYLDCKKIDRRPPNILISGHVHTAAWNMYVAREKAGYHVVHGIICPSWQAKTRFVYKAAPMEVNEIGAVFLEIAADGQIGTPHFELMETKTEGAIKI